MSKAKELIENVIREGSSLSLSDAEEYVYGLVDRNAVASIRQSSKGILVKLRNEEAYNEIVYDMDIGGYPYDEVGSRTLLMK